MTATLLEAKADHLETRVTALERSLGGEGSCSRPAGRCSSDCRTHGRAPHSQTPTKQNAGLAIGGGVNGGGNGGGPSATDLAALRELLLAAKQEHDALAKAKAQAEERAERLEYRVSMLVASLREADKALGKTAVPMPERRKQTAAVEDDDDEAAEAAVA